MELILHLKNNKHKATYLIDVDDGGSWNIVIKASSGSLFHTDDAYIVQTMYQ